MRTTDASAATPSTPAPSASVPPVPDRIGVIGLGSMGEPMARRLLAHHGRVHVHSRSRKQALLDAGATWANTPRDLAAQVDAVLVMLPDLPQLLPMFDGPDGLLAAEGPLLILLGSTSSPVAVRELAEQLDQRTDGRVRVVDVPVSGGEAGARAGTLAIMAGGEPALVARAAVLLAPCGTVHHLGPLGAGEVAKACNQLIVAATMFGLAEASVLAERSGLDLDALYTMLDGGYAGSNLLRDKRERLLSGNEEPGGIAAYMLKDLAFAAAVAEGTGTHPALLPVLRDAVAELVAAGLGDKDLVVAKRFIAQRTQQ